MNDGIGSDYNLLKTQVLDYSIKIFTGLALSLIISILIIDKFLVSKFNIGYFFAAITLIVLLIFIKRVSYSLKIWLVFIVSIIIMSQGLYRGGRFSPTLVFIVVNCVLFSFLISKKWVYLMLFAFFIVYGFFAYAFLNHYFEAQWGEGDSDFIVQTWVLRGVVVFYSTIGLINIASYYDKIISSSFSLIKQKSFELDNYRLNLEELVKDRTKELEESLTREKELGLLKTNFISMASHEFRTPLAAIRGSAELILNYSDKLSKQQVADRLNKIKDEVGNMTSMLEEILVIGKDGANKIEFNPVTINLVDLVKETIVEYQFSHGTDRKIQYELESDVINCGVEVKLMKQVVTNLFSNALKYSEFPSPITICISRENNNIIFTISDKGIGMSAKDQNAIFEPFYRGENVDAILGTGLGLAIVEKAIIFHGGTINIISEVGKGTTFRIVLPSLILN
jgi:signal transduction histidine kinase